MANKLTTVSVTQETKKKLDVLKIIPRESYDAVLNRLIEENDNDTK